MLPDPLWRLEDLQFIHKDNMIIVALLIQIATGFALNSLRQQLGLVADEQKALEASSRSEICRVHCCHNRSALCQLREAE